MLIKVNLTARVHKPIWAADISSTIASLAHPQAAEDWLVCVDRINRRLVRIATISGDVRLGRFFNCSPKFLRCFAQFPPRFWSTIFNYFVQYICDLFSPRLPDLHRLNREFSI